MAINKTIVVDKCEVVSLGSTYTTNTWKVLQVRTATVIDEDGTELSRSFHRHVINPGTLTGVGLTGITITDVSGEDASVQAIAGAVFDATCLEAYRVTQVGIRSESISG